MTAGKDRRSTRGGILGIGRMEKHGSPTLSHIGICVSDMERSVRFYCTGLGCELVREADVGNEISDLFELEPEVDISTMFLRCGGSIIELMHFRSPGHSGSPKRTPINSLGLAMLTFSVDDLDAVAMRLSNLGGTVLERTRTVLTFPSVAVEVLTCIDPDGVRLELSASKSVSQA